MEKGFNDQELADIMNEIEALEKEFQDPQQHVDNSVMAELAEMSEETAIPTAQVIPMNVKGPTMTTKSTSEKTTSQSQTSMSFHVEGNMNLQLSFMINGEEVKLHVTEQGLNIEMQSGVSLNVPVKSVSASKKVA
jgi:hypothetical protein